MDRSVYYDSSGYGHGFLDTAGTFTTIDVPGATFGTLAYGINNEGQITTVETFPRKYRVISMSFDALP